MGGGRGLLGTLRHLYTDWATNEDGTHSHSAHQRGKGLLTVLGYEGVILSCQTEKRSFDALDLVTVTGIRVVVRHTGIAEEGHCQSLVKLRDHINLHKIHSARSHTTDKP